MGISISASARDDNPTLLHFNYIVFLHAARISISIFSSPSLSLRQLYSPCQRPHVINLCHPRVMFILFKRAPREEPIKKKERERNRFTARRKPSGGVITEFQHRFCVFRLPFPVQSRRAAMIHAARWAEAIHFNAVKAPFPGMGSGQPL